MKADRVFQISAQILLLWHMRHFENPFQAFWWKIRLYRNLTVQISKAGILFRLLHRYQDTFCIHGEDFRQLFSRYMHCTHYRQNRLKTV